MPRRFPFFLAAFLLMIASCSERELGAIRDGQDASVDAGDAGLCGLGDDGKAAERVFAIVSGTPEPTLYRFTYGQTLAMGGLLRKTTSGGWFPVCNAELVADDAVITAAHCLLDETGPLAPDQVRFALGEDLQNPLSEMTVAFMAVHPDYNPVDQAHLAEHDLAVLILEKPATQTLPGITPLPLNRDPLASDLPGRLVQIEGFGDIGPDPTEINTRRYWTVEPISALNRFEFVVDGRDLTGVCAGDSGGPAFLKMPDHVVRLLGTVSWGDYSCVGLDHFTRVDAETGWLDGILGDRPADYCNGVDSTGLCLSGVRFWCEAGRISEQDCVLEGGRCVQDAVGARCEDVDAMDPCYRLGFIGACNPGDVAVWCENGEVKKRKCAPCGQVCAFAGPDLGYYCVD